MSIKAVLVLGLCLGIASGFEDKTIAQWLTDNGYTTLVTLLKQANLYDTLNKPGAYTLFAPTNSAFSKIPPATLTTVTGDAALLENVLKNHVLQGFTMAPAIHDGDVKPALSGQNLQFHKSPAGIVTVQGAQVDPASSDIILNNGVVHVIESVILPPTEKIGEILLKRGTEFSTLNMLLTITDLEPALLTGKITLFAPTNAAFNSITQRLPDFDAPGAVEKYKKILLNHVVNSTALAGDLKDGQTIPTLGTSTLTVHKAADGTVTVSPTGSSIIGKVIEADVKAANGVMHVVDQVLIPNGVVRRSIIDRDDLIML